MTKASSNTKNPGIYALIIGINEYFNTDDLPRVRGAVNDARAFEKYLLDVHHVPSSNIVVLENKEATRSAIISTFSSHLTDKPNIPDHGEAAMIFFFAGHGSRFGAPSDLIAPDRRVEAICPVDERTNDAREYVYPIPDYVLGWLLCDLARKKGPNITVILDCCHSGTSVVLLPCSSLFPDLYYRRYGTGCREGSECSYSFLFHSIRTRQSSLERQD
ncbi:hypothetical protein B0H13DRAFT_1634839 [Mycena leptocephala]|nr:hypothetical protein B0H13DRAFT_1634839 [Mycena leptocephala]